MKRVDQEDEEQEVVETENQKLAGRHHRTLVAGIVILLGAGIASMRFAPSLTLYVASYSLATLAWLALCLSLGLFPPTRSAPPTIPSVRERGRKLGDRGPAFPLTLGVVAVAVLLRLPFLLGESKLSPDVNRYRWDGRVSASGVNPYRYAPEAAAVADLRDGNFASMQHRETRSVYPPWSQFLFLGWVLLGGQLVLWRIFLLVCDLALVIFLRKQAGWLPAIAYAACPFVISEGVWNGHLDLIAGALVMVSVVIAARRGLLAGALLGVAAGIKLSPIAAAPALARRGGVRFLMACLSLFLIPAAIYGLSGGIMTGLSEFAERWSFHSPLYELTRWSVASSRLDQALGSLWTAVKDPLRLESISPFVYAHLYPDSVARVILAVALVVALTWVVRKRSERAALDSIGVLLILSPTIHPWYWLTLLPLALVGRSRLWLAVALASPVSYLTYANSFSTPLILALSYGPAAALALAQAISALRDRDISRWMALRGDSPS